MSPAIIWTTGTARRTRDIYWSPVQPTEDLKAQLIVALLQFKFVQDESPFAKWLQEYIAKFKIYRREKWVKLPWPVRKDVVQTATSNLLKQHGLPENYRGWRIYVKSILSNAFRESCPFTKPLPEVDRLRLTLANSHSVSEFAREIGVSRRAAYKLLKEGLVEVLPGRPIRITRSEVERVIALRRRRLRRQKLRQAERKKLEHNGKTPEAARKSTYRKHGPLSKMTDHK